MTAMPRAPDISLPADGTRFEDTVVVLRVIALKPDTEWAVLSVADRNGELVKLAGPLLKRYSVPGRRITVIGRWKAHHRFGIQVSVTHAEPAMRFADDAVSAVAALQRVPFIGRKRAQALVDRYGAHNALNKIDANPKAAFTRVGVAYPQASIAAKWWREQRDL